MQSPTNQTPPFFAFPWQGEFKFDIVHGVGYYDGHPFLDCGMQGGQRKADRC